MQYRILPFSVLCSSWILFVTDSILCLVNSWASVIQLHLVSASDALAFFCFGYNGFPCACLRERSFTRHCSCLWCFQLSPCSLNDVFVFFVTRINRINSPQFCGMFEFGFLDCTFLIFSSLSGFSNSCSSVRLYVIWTWCRFDFCQSSPRTTYILLEEFRSMMWILWNPSPDLTDFCFRRRSNSHQFVFLVLHPNRCELTWWYQYISVE